MGDPLNESIVENLETENQSKKAVKKQAKEAAKAAKVCINICILMSNALWSNSRLIYIFVVLLICCM